MTASSGVESVEWSTVDEHRRGKRDIVEIVTKAGIHLAVYVSPEGRTVRVFKRKPGKESHELGVIQGAPRN